MGVEIKLISWTIGLALALASVGRLPEAAMWLAKKVAEAQPKMVSLERFNRQLMGKSCRSRPIKHGGSLGTKTAQNSKHY